MYLTHIKIYNWTLYIYMLPPPPMLATYTASLTSPTWVVAYWNNSNTKNYRKKRNEEAEMKLLRPLAGYTLHDHKTKDSVRRELQTECILDKTDEYRRNWFLQLQRMPLNRIPLKSYHYRPQGRRTIGRPKKRWRKQL
jgi:hypothetical protein